MPNIFDQIHAEAQGVAPAPAGNIFDQIHAEANAPKPPAVDPEDVPAGGDPAFKPDPKEAAWNQQFQKQNQRTAANDREARNVEAGQQQWAAAHPFLNPALQAKQAVGNFLLQGTKYAANKAPTSLGGQSMDPSLNNDLVHNPGFKGMYDSIMNPKPAPRGNTQLSPQQNTNVSQALTMKAGDPNTLGGKVGKFAGEMAPVMAAAPVGMSGEVMALQGDVQAEQDTNAAIASGTMTPEQAARYRATGAALNYGVGKLMPGGRTFGAAIEGAGVNAIENPIARKAAATGLGVVTSGNEMGGLQLAQNQNAIRNNLDPTRDPVEGVRQQMLLGSAMAVPHGLLHGGPPTALAEAKNAHAVRSEPYDFNANLPKTETGPMSSDDAHVRMVQERMAEAQAKDVKATPGPTPALDNIFSRLRQQHAEGVVDADRPWSAADTASTGTPRELEEGQHHFDTAGEDPYHNTDTRVKDLSQTERRVNAAPREEGQENRFPDLADRATFQTPEEANQKPVPPPLPPLPPTAESMHEEENYGKPWPKDAVAPNALQKASGEHAVAEEYGKPVEPESAKAGSSLLDKAHEAVSRLGSEESGGMSANLAGKAFVEQDVAPAAKKAWEGIKNIGKAFDRSENFGLTTSKTAKQEQLNLIRSFADAKMAGRQHEAWMKPFIAEAPKFSDDPTTANAWADMMAKGVAPTNELQPFVDQLQDLRAANATRAEKLGDKRLDAEGYGLSRRFTFPDDTSGKGGGSVAGSEDYRNSQKYETRAEAQAAVDKAGGKNTYNDPVTEQIAAQYEFERSLGLRERLRKSEDEGQTPWSSDTEKLPEGHVKLTDKISREERTDAYPKWVVGKYAGMTSFEGNKFLDDNAGQRVYVRPGEDAPDGYSKTDHTTKGTYHAADDVAHMWNTAAHHGEGSPLAKLPERIAQASTQFMFEYSGAHALSAELTHIGKSSFDALSKLWGGKKGTSLTDIAGELALFGPETNRLMREIKSPGSDPEPRIQEIARRIQRGGAGISAKSVLDQNHWREVSDKFKSGNWAGGALSSLTGVGKEIKAGTYDQVLNRIAAIAAKRTVVDQMARGISEDKGQAEVLRSSEAINRGVGRHTDIPTFKESVMARVGKVIMPAFSFRSGLVRNLAETCRGNPHAASLVVGNLMAGAVAGTAICRMFGGRWPSTIQDAYNPPIGGTNDAGHERRLSMGIWSFLPRLLGADGWEGVQHEVKGMVNPMLTGAAEVVKNKDFSGNQIRPTGGSLIGNTTAGVGHVAKQMLPLVGKAQMQTSPEAEDPTLGERALHFAGFGTGHPVTSPAEKAAYDLLDSRGDLPGRTPEKQAEHANQTKWVRDIRAGQGDQVETEMAKDPTMTQQRHDTVFKRAESKQNLVRLMHDSRFGAEDLATVWGKASDADKVIMKPAIMERLDGAKPKSEADNAAWEKLYQAISGGK